MYIYKNNKLWLETEEQSVETRMQRLSILRAYTLKNYELDYNTAHSTFLGSVARREVFYSLWERYLDDTRGDDNLDTPLRRAFMFFMRYYGNPPEFNGLVDDALDSGSDKW